jgi:PAS domain S-box-containing protein
VIGKTCLELGYEQWHHDMHMREIAQVIETKRPIKGEVPFKAPLTGIFGVYEYIFTPVINPPGEVELIAGTTRDVSQRKQHEEALRQSEFFHRQMLESIPGMVFTTRPDGYCDYQSQQWVEYTGVPMSEHLGNGWNTLLHPEDQPKAFAAWRSAIENDAPYDLEYRVRRSDGVYEWFKVIGIQIRDAQGQVIRWFGVAMNIEQLKKTEEQLRSTLAASDERRRTFDAMMEHIPMGITIADVPDATISAVSRYGLEMARKPREQLEGIPLNQYAAKWEVFHPDGITPAMHEALPLTRAVQKGELVKQEEWVIGRPDGTKVPVLCNAAPICDSHGVITGGVMGYQDITQRKDMEETLRESEKKFRELADSMPQLVWTAAPDGKVDYYNVRYKNYQGIDLTPDGTFKWDPVLHEEDQAPTVEAWNKAYRTGEIYQIEHRVKLIDGSYRWHLSRGVPVLDAAGRIVKWFGTATDIENVKQTEAQLRQLNENLEQKVAQRTKMAETRSQELQKLAVELIEAEERERQRISRLLHDDLQQMLAAAKMQLQAALDSMSAEPMLTSVGQILEQSIAKSRHLSHELSPPALYHTGLVAGLNWLSAQMTEKFGLQVDLKATEELCVVDEPLKIFIFRAVQELLFNIVKHGKVNSAQVDLVNSNGNLMLAVIDRGSGFDPGTLCSSDVKGLGLISLRERANAMGGSLAIESSPGKGSRFVLNLPAGPGQNRAYRQMVDPCPAVRENDLFASGSTKARVLFADDHGVMRQGLIKLIAGQTDIEVVGEAASGREAVELARQLRPDIILMDVSMPDMDGIQATRQIKSELPEVRVVALSMHEDEHIHRTMRNAGADAFVSKSATPTELLEAIFKR